MLHRRELWNSVSLTGLPSSCLLLDVSLLSPNINFPLFLFFYPIFTFCYLLLSYAFTSVDFNFFHWR